MQLWIEYNGREKQINVTLALINVDKPDILLLSLKIDLSPIMKDPMYVGFSSSHYVLGWGFNLNGPAKKLTLSTSQASSSRTEGEIQVFDNWVADCYRSFCVHRGLKSPIYRGKKRKFVELVEDWEMEYGPHRFKYKDLYLATKGFRDNKLLGSDGFGRVYRGILPTSETEVAVKRVSHESRQGMKEFVTKVVSIGRMRHRNLVQLLGYCRRKGEMGCKNIILEVLDPPPVIVV
ncbi:PREDICTED: L-type lectin-domain containing receptor kinase V.9-like [Nelumbo nucifera]|uniref:non-specific serine/threonine protein kinase n=1 Tax=Nelumbo nucifera TaxID=4432 RepID=A0A1U8Q879_NELNU|nr:PREDICTED: L-type lectin-domain containing receptor kinase V.9-like [Nelumbo nucifera]